jgi:hypothetical protein
MNRVAVMDEEGKIIGWFDKDQAHLFDEDTYWNGNNHISKATGSQWDHQALYRTRCERWVLHCWSQYQGSEETYEEITPQDAALWLVKNGHEHKDVQAEIESQEI